MNALEDRVLSIFCSDVFLSIMQNCDQHIVWAVSLFFYFPVFFFFFCGGCYCYQVLIFDLWLLFLFFKQFENNYLQPPFILFL